MFPFNSQLQAQLEAAQKAARFMASLSNEKRQSLLHAIADELEASTTFILEANQKDAQKMDDQDPKKDRLILDEARLSAIASDVRTVAGLPDPVGNIEIKRTLENELQLQKISVPLGVVGAIYESRPNVTVDISVLALRSGNGVVLRGGSDAFHSNVAIVQTLHQAMKKEGVDSAALQLLPTDRALVKELLQAKDYVDILIPRGSQGLIDFVRENADIPTIETGAGVCHTYVHSSADLEKAARIVENAKLTRPSVCNALDTVVVDRSVAADFLPLFLSEFEKNNVEIYADDEAYPTIGAAKYSHLHHASDEDFGREFLGFGCSVKVVEDLDEALDHIATYSSKHSEAIVAEDAEICEKFLAQVDAAAVYANASTRFTDGGVFGLGAEIGISTQKLHARGPFALEKLVTEKWVVRGDGQVR